MKEEFFVYILSNERNTVVYTGITNDLYRRVIEHKMGKGSLFTSKYHCSKLVYYEVFLNPDIAIAREKQIKKYSRKKKETLVNKENLDWGDLFTRLGF